MRTVVFSLIVMLSTLAAAAETTVEAYIYRPDLDVYEQLERDTTYSTCNDPRYSNEVLLVVTVTGDTGPTDGKPVKFLSRISKTISRVAHPGINIWPESFDPASGFQVELDDGGVGRTIRWHFTCGD